jgi:restriction system protein
MRPLLELASDGEEQSLRQAYEELANTFSLSDEERRELLPSGKQARFNNRVAWARTYMKQAGLLEDTRRGHFKITERGREALESGERIDSSYLERFDEFQEFKNRTSKADDGGSRGTTATGASDQTPEEQLEAAHQTLQADLSEEVLQAIKSCSPEFFERLVVDVLVTMGYGGSRKEAGQAVGRSGDEGIDGIIKEDRLGLDAIYIQAKRWEAVVGRPEVQKFAGALQGARARKGIMITTSSFTKGADEYANGIDTKIILIDGARLAELMIEHNVGVTPVSRFEVKRLDQDYFVDE